MTKIALFALAVLKYGRIHRCSGAPRWRDSFTIHKGRTMFWFNDSTGSTRVGEIGFWRKRAPKKKAGEK